jgi:D-Tyr-tRNAtyr deacylase
VRLLYVDIDTLRADHLACAGYHRATTPTIDALAADGVRFREQFCALLETQLGKPVARGVFGAHMDVELVNDGPATLMLERPRD